MCRRARCVDLALPNHRNLTRSLRCLQEIIPGGWLMPKLSAIRFNEHTAPRAKPQDKVYEIMDAGYRGLALRVLPTGTKTWYLRVSSSKRARLGDAGKLTLEQARTKARKIESEYDETGQLPTRSTKPQTLEEFATGEYKRWALEHQKDGEANVHRVEMACASLMKKKLDELAQIHVERWKTSRLKSGIKPSTVNRDLQGLKSVLNRAVDWGVLTESPAASVRRVRAEEDHRVRYLEPDERKRLLAALVARDEERSQARLSGIEHAIKRHREPLEPFTGTYTDYLHPLVLLAMNTGLRRSEALSLTWSQVRLTGTPMVTVQAAQSKSAKTRHVYLNKVAVKVLRDWKNQGEGEGLVFSHLGKQIKRIDTAWGSLMKKAEITEFRFHDLRHDFASQLVMNGIDLYTVRELLGHGSIEMTQRYAHLAPDRLQNAVSVLNTNVGAAS